MNNLVTQHEAIALLQEERKKLNLNVREFGDLHGVSKQYMRSVFIGLIPPSEKFGFEKVEMFKPVKKKKVKR